MFVRKKKNPVKGKGWVNFGVIYDDKSDWTGKCFPG
jgi:hypothetical protein